MSKRVKIITMVVLAVLLLSALSVGVVAAQQPGKADWNAGVTQGFDYGNGVCDGDCAGNCNGDCDGDCTGDCTGVCGENGNGQANCNGDCSQSGSIAGKGFFGRDCGGCK